MSPRRNSLSSAVSDQRAVCFSGSLTSLVLFQTNGTKEMNSFGSETKLVPSRSTGPPEGGPVFVVERPYFDTGMDPAAVWASSVLLVGGACFLACSCCLVANRYRKRAALAEEMLARSQSNVAAGALRRAEKGGGVGSKSGGGERAAVDPCAQSRSQ